ncbi:hypothetical protein CEP54_012940 [Fusarium duplospermum]|uniref:Zn(2)-C6 fungal-type domain-containing protein n=1 Tax=Fusarium duplospermum TaxID=1325734 RepID=A0A428P622_9HYPO|nr:hypothetical protein CEP54_012940 [Fusarium duplospermum]
MRPKRACDVCYKRKIQCVIGNTDEPCEWCSHHDLVCTFDRETQKKPNNVQAIASDVQELLRRVANLENSLSQVHSQRELSNQASPSSAPSTTLGATQGTSVSGVRPSSINAQNTSQTVLSSVTSPSATSTTFKPEPTGISDVARHLGQNWFHKGIPILSPRGRDWIRLKTGQDPHFERFRLFGSKCSSRSIPLTNFPHDELHKLPDQHYAQRCIDAFFGSSFYFFYPVLDRALVQETFELAYRDPDGLSFTRSQASGKACILASLPMISRMIRPNDAPYLLKGDMYAKRAQSLLSLVSWEANLEGLQATLMLQIYKTSVGEWEDASTLHSIACHMVCSLGGHLNRRTTCEPRNFSSERRHQHTRALFWMSYTFDKEISLRSGQPPLLTEDYCDLTAPEGYTSRYECQSPADQDDSSFESLMPYLPGDLGLSHVKEKTCRLLYSPKSFTIDDTQILRHIRHLDIDLESWRSSIPQRPIFGSESFNIDIA